MSSLARLFQFRGLNQLPARTGHHSVQYGSSDQGKGRTSPGAAAPTVDHEAKLMTSPGWLRYVLIILAIAVAAQADPETG